MSSIFFPKNINFKVIHFSLLLLLISPLSQAELTAKRIDQLTKQWLETERQTSHLKSNWKKEEPLLEQRIKLLKLEKNQLNKLLKTNSASTNKVEQKREELLKQQAKLESEQLLTLSAITRLKERLDNLAELLPPPLKNDWQTENSDNNAVVLEQQLSRLSKLAEFNGRITLHSMRLVNSKNQEILVKQLYLGLSQAWFSSQNGQYSGYGLIENGTWNWHFTNDISSEPILDAIAIVENQKIASEVALDIVQLPTGTIQ